MASNEAPPIQARIEFIAGLMAENKYRTHITIRELAKLWGLSVHTVEKDAMSAGRMFKVPPEHADAVRARLAATFETIAHDALANPSRVSGLPDYRAAIEALERYAQFSGVAPGDEQRTTDPVKIIIAYEDDPPGPGQGTDPSGGA